MEYDSETSKSMNIDLKHSCDVDINNVEIPMMEFSFDQALVTIDNYDFVFGLSDNDLSNHNSVKSLKPYICEGQAIQLTNPFSHECLENNRFFILQECKQITNDIHENYNILERQDSQNVAQVFTIDEELDEKNTLNIDDLNPTRKYSDHSCEAIDTSDIIDKTEYTDRQHGVLDNDSINKIFINNLEELHLQRMYSDVIYEESVEEDHESDASWSILKDPSSGRNNNIMDNKGFETPEKYNKSPSIDYCLTKNDTNSNADMFEHFRTNITSNDDQISNQFTTSNKIEDVMMEPERRKFLHSSQFCKSYMRNFLLFLVPCMPLNKRKIING